MLADTDEMSPDTAVIYITDDTLVSLDYSFLKKAQCHHTYAEIEGEIGYLPPHRFHGLRVVSSIRAFPNEKYKGDGTECYNPRKRSSVQ